MATCNNPKCRKRIPDDHRICGYCGRPQQDTFVTGFSVSSAQTGTVPGTTDLDLSYPSEVVLQHERVGKQILCTLWDMQLEQYGGRSDNRAGFRLDHLTTGFPAIKNALRELRFRGLVGQDEQAVYYLTDHGMALCDERLNCQNIERLTVEDA